MSRRKQSFPETVQLLLNGPKSILPEQVLVGARLDHTWYQLLNGEVGLELTPESGIYVCNVTYTPSDPKPGVGWRADLNDQIGDFMSKFERKKKRFTVRLCHPEDVAPFHKKTGGTPGRRRQRRSRQRSATPGPSTRGPNIIVPTQGAPPTTPTSTTTRRSTRTRRASAPATEPEEYKRPRYTPNANVHQQRHYGTRQNKRHHQTVGEITLQGAVIQERPGISNGELRLLKRQRLDNLTSPPEEGPSTTTGQDTGFRLNMAAVKIESVVGTDSDWGDSSEWDDGQQEDNNGQEVSSDSGQGGDDDDTASLLTAVTVEEAELRREGIQVEDLKTKFEARSTRFSNAILLRIRNEINKLKQDNTWDRNVSRAPLASYLLQELFKE